MPKGQRDVTAHRGEDMDPLLIRPVGVPPGTPAGFELVRPDEIDLAAALTTKQMEHWQKLPAEFRFNDMADALESECGRLSGRAWPLRVRLWGGKRARRAIPRKLTAGVVESRTKITAQVGNSDRRVSP
jgi:hypothetical protein